MRWCFPAQKTRFQLRILNVPWGKSHIGVRALSYALHLRCEKFLLGWQGTIVSHYISNKLIVLRKCCTEKSTLPFGAKPFLKGRYIALLWIKWKKACYIREIMRWCFPAQKTRFQLLILNVPRGKSHIGVRALSSALHLRCEKFLLGWQGTIVFHYISKKLTFLRKCCTEKSTLHFRAKHFLKGR